MSVFGASSRLNPGILFSGVLNFCGGCRGVYPLPKQNFSLLILTVHRMGKHYDHLWHQIISFNNLWWAFKKAARGKRSKSTVADFEYDLEPNLIQLQEELKSGSYHPGQYVSFYVHEAKRRLVSAAPFRDRVVHHTLINIKEPIFEPKDLSCLNQNLFRDRFWIKCDPYLARLPVKTCQVSDY